ncbi:ferritin family protein [candidate division KSB1 bacterium]|nr:ferritin family protein [candidate division KSB1 bacterium]
MKKIITKAIQREVEARQVYLKAAELTDAEELKNLFLWLADEEKIHEDKLRALEPGRLSGEGDISETPSMVDFLQDPPPAALDNIQNVLIFAMKRERKAFNFYGNLAQSVADKSIKAVLFWLAGEEKIHLEKIESVYDSKIQPEN